MPEMSSSGPPLPALLPEVSLQETYKVDDLFYFQDPEGWHSMPYDPSGALLDINIFGL